MESGTPSVSVIVRSIDRPTLQHTLASIALQTYPALEVVLVGASGPGHRVPAVHCGPHRCRFVASEVQLRRADAANAGLDAATGEWITFLDDDDLWLADHVSGLVAAIPGASSARLIHSRARVEFADGSVDYFGQHCSMIQLHERNYIHLSTALVARSLVVGGARFDSSLDIHEDWEFFLQCVQHTRLHFTPQTTFVWRADAGSSGGGGGRNHHAANFAAMRDRVYAKWAAQREALLVRVQALLESAAAFASKQRYAEAMRACAMAMQTSPDDPWVLNMEAMIERAQGRLSRAMALQQMAVARRPQDPDFVYNLALICRDMGDAEGARAHCQFALFLVPDSPRFQSLAQALSSASPRPT